MSQDWFELRSEPIDVNRVTAFVYDPAAGGVALFLGATRAQTSQEGHALAALDYDAYADMAIRQIQELGARARERWPIVRLAILHRTGRVVVGEASVAIAVSCGHRGEAFEACRWLIDTLKAEVAVWKKEVWEGGRQTWVHP